MRCLAPGKEMRTSARARPRAFGLGNELMMNYKLFSARVRILSRKIFVVVNGECSMVNFFIAPLVLGLITRRDAGTSNEKLFFTIPKLTPFSIIYNSSPCSS